MSNTAFEPPKHHSAVSLSQDLAAVVRETAQKAGRSFEEQLVDLVIKGAECARLHNDLRR